MKISGNIVDVVAGVIYPGTLEIRDGIIVDIVKETKSYDTYIIPGLIDSHVHIESSMLVPSEFARLAVTHGTVGAVCDPHEIANVLGIEGVRSMIENGSTTPFKFSFGAPSCVPATPYETSGARIGAVETKTLLRDSRIHYLSEMMNFPGVIGNDSEVMAKIAATKKQNKPIDGHAPALRSAALQQYVAAGITTDHECCEREEALEKIGLGVKILIREGSAAKNFEALYSLIEEYPDVCMFCSDDKHPDDFRVVIKGRKIRVIEAIENQLITNSLIETPCIENGNAVSDTERDILKIAVVNRYKDRPPALGFIKNFGLRKGAIASSVAHDSHNIIVVGVTDEAICAAVNLIIEQKGGISLVSDEFQEVLSLPIAGIMSDEDGFIVAEKYARLNALARDLGTRLSAPFMALSFMALLVIPQLKLSDRGLFDGQSFSFVDLFVE
jgi:adenine deaminase